MIRIRVTLAALILLLAHSFACSSRPGLEHFDRPEESGKVEVKNDGTAIIRSMHSEIAIRQIQDEEWENLLEFTPFINEKSGFAQYRVPRLKFFMASLKNTSEQPLVLENVSLSYGDVSMDNMDSKRIKDTFKSDIFKFFNFDEIFTPRRLVTEEENLEKINFDTDTIRYELSFIPPSDRLIRIIAFPTLPVTVRSYRINFHLSYTGIKKIIAFDMQRFEYRTRGKHFIEKKQEYEDLP
ncbi:MAG: hypothetical protein CVV44_18480 [Spirochaetae bacterium HGW-Spirochaetae-1]|jgi:hypothetical protein|nr:MAG: hypothetical protein CVV44_18480 [Spirochaetae bacterium HGW-Spirochaetae-1]